MMDESKNKPYVKKFTGTLGQDGWKAMNKHGKTKFFNNEKSAHTHAGLNEVLGKENDIGTPALTKKYKAMTPGQEKAQIPVTEGTWIVSGQHQEQGHVRSKTYKASSKDHAISQFHDDHGEDNYSITKTRQLDKLKGESVEEPLTEKTRSPTITVRENGKEKKVKHADYHKDMQALMAGRIGIGAFKNKYK